VLALVVGKEIDAAAGDRRGHVVDGRRALSSFEAVRVFLVLA
jgi:hypothetical protein